MYQTELANRAQQFRRALSDDDLDAAVEHGVRLAQATETDRVSVLTDLKQALENRDDETARTLFEQLSDVYDDNRPAEEVRTARANAALRQVSSGTGAVQVLNGYVQSQAEADTSRANLFGTVGLFLGGAEGSPSRLEAIDAVEAAIADERTLDRRGERIEAADLATAVNLPPTLTVVEAAIGGGPGDEVQQGSSTTLSTRVRNAGNETANGVAVAAEPGSSDAVSVGEGVELGSLSPDDTDDATISVTGIEPGIYTLSVVATADEARRSSTLVTLSVAAADTDPGLGRFDTNGRPGIQYDEVLAAIRAFRADEEIGGEPVPYEDVLRVITAFRSGG